MSNTPNAGFLRTNEYPNGIATMTDLQRLFGALNPFIDTVKNLGSKGVSIAQNLDAQLVPTFQITTPGSDWTAFTPVTWTNSGGAYPPFGWRVDLSGDVYLRGRIATLPALATTLATLPTAASPFATYRLPVDAAGAYGAIEVTAGGVITQQVGSILGTMDVVAQFPSALSQPSAFSNFPFQIKTKDRRQPKGCLLLSCLDHTQANPSNTPNNGGSTPSILVPGLQWSFVQSGTGGSFISIDGMPGLSLGRTYDVSLLVLY